MVGCRSALAEKGNCDLEFKPHSCISQHVWHVSGSIGIRSLSYNFEPLYNHCCSSTSSIANGRDAILPGLQLVKQRYKNTRP